MSINSYWLLAAIAFSGVACTPPKILVAHSYATSDKSLQTVIQQSGDSVQSANGEDEVQLYNVYMRVCDQGQDNTLSRCQDSLLLSNVHPGTI